MTTSICFTLKQNGVLSTESTIRLFATMLITGKTLGGDLISLSIMHLRCAQIGRRELLSAIMKRDASYSLAVSSHMVGRKKYITHWYTRHSLAPTSTVGVPMSNVPFITIRMIEDQSQSKISDRSCTLNRE